VLTPDFQDAAFEDFEAVFVSELLDGCLSVAVHLKSHTSSLTRTTKPDTSPHDCSVSNQTTYATRADRLLAQAISQVGVSQKFVSEIPVSSLVFQHL
jgi:hypothetical protein